MIDVRKLLDRKATSSADLALLIPEAREAGTAAAAIATGLNEERAGLLLTADDAVLADHDARILAAQLQHDRAAAVVAELERRHAETHEAEVEAGRRARYQAAKRESSAHAKWLREAYPKHAAEIGRGLTRLAEVEALIRHVNDDLPKGEPSLLELEGSIRNVSGTVSPLKYTVDLPGLTARDPAPWSIAKA